MAPGGASRPVGPPAFFQRRDLGLVALGAGMYVLVAWFLPLPILALPLGLFTLCFAPGYALGVLLFGYHPRWPWSLTFVSVVGLSVAWSVGEGLVLLELGAGLPAQVFSLVALGLLGLAFLVPAEPAPTLAPSFGAYLRREFRLPGHSPAQRALGYTLLAGLVAVVLVIVYLATVFPGNAPAVSLGIAGATGQPPPTAGPLGQALFVNVSVGNNATAQTLDLTVRAVLDGQAPGNFTAVPWRFPLALGANRSSTDPITLPAGGTVDLEVPFELSTRGSFVVEFVLAGPSGTVLVSTSTPVTIT